MKTALPLFAALSLSACAGQPLAASPRPAFDLPPHLAQTVKLAHDPAARYVMIEAHRGAVGPGRPENSIPALIRSAEIGVDVIEIDVRRTKDGVLILMHDKKLDRTTTLSGAVADMSFAEVSAARLRDTDGSATDLAIPTLAEALEAMRGQSLFRLDVKCEPECLDAIYRMVDEKGLMDQAVMLDRHVARAYGAGLTDDRIIVSGERIDKLGSPDNLPPFHDYAQVRDFAGALPRALIAEFAQRTRVMAFSYDDRRVGGLGDDLSMKDPDAGWGVLIDAGVDMFLTDEPEALIRYLEKRGLRQRGG